MSFIFSIEFLESGRPLYVDTTVVSPSDSISRPFSARNCRRGNYLLGNPPELLCFLCSLTFLFSFCFRFIYFFYCLPDRAFSPPCHALPLFCSRREAFFPICFRRRAFFSHLLGFLRDFFSCVRRTSIPGTPSILYELVVAEPHQISTTTAVPQAPQAQHSTTQRSQPAQQAAKQVRADQSATTQASRRSWLAPACHRACIYIYKHIYVHTCALLAQRPRTVFRTFLGVTHSGFTLLYDNRHN